MRYYRLAYSDEKKDNLPQGSEPIVVNFYDVKDFDLTVFWKGTKVDQWDKSIELSYASGNFMFDYIPNILSWELFSDKALEVIKRLKIEAEIFPITIYGEVSHEETHANVVNVLSSISAFNWKKSDYVSWDDDPSDMKYICNAVLNRKDLIDSPDIFRLQEYKLFIIVTDTFKNEIEKSNLTGFDFWEIEVL